MTEDQREGRYEDDLKAQERHKRYREQLQHLQWERDALLLVLRGHLYVEQELNYLLSHRVPAEAFKKLLKQGFMRKLNLANDLGIISPETYAASQLLNEYRNRLAHNLGGVVGEAEADALYDMLEKAGVFAGSEMHKDDDPMVTLSRCIRAVYTLYTSEVWSLRTGRQLRMKLGPWVTEELDKDTFAKEQRALYEEAQRLKKLLDESPQARQELDEMIADARRKVRERYGDLFDSDKGSA